MQDKPVESIRANPATPPADKPFLTPLHYPGDPLTPRAAPTSSGTRRASRGRLFTHVILPLGLVFALLAGLVWVKQNLPQAEKSAWVPPPVKPGMACLQFDQERAVWDAAEPAYAAEFEFGSQGFYDFPFTNVTDLPVQLFLGYTSCGCSNVNVCVLNPDELAAFKKDKKGDRLAWQPMSKEDGPGFKIPPHHGGVVRLGWTVRKMNLTILTVKLRSQAAKRPPDPETTLEAPVNFVMGIRCSPRIKDFNSLGPHSVGRAEFFVWSATRDHFDLEVKDRKQNPCFVYDVKPLSAAERQVLHNDLAERERGLNTRPKVAYRVTVEVHEERDGQHLDLGPFERTVPMIVDHNEAADPVGPTLKGVVRGDLVFGTPEDQGHVHLKNFLVSSARQYLFTISTGSGVKLVPEQVPDFLEVGVTAKETANGKTVWQMRVAIKPRVLRAGPLPDNCAIILRTEEMPPRRIRIPVTGNGVPG